MTQPKFKIYNPQIYQGNDTILKIFEDNKDLSLNPSNIINDPRPTFQFLTYKDFYKIVFIAYLKESTDTQLLQNRTIITINNDKPQLEAVLSEIHQGLNIVFKYGRLEQDYRHNPIRLNENTFKEVISRTNDLFNYYNGYEYILSSEIITELVNNEY